MITDDAERPCLGCSMAAGECLAMMNGSEAQMRCCGLCGINDMHSAEAHHRVTAALDGLSEPQRTLLDRSLGTLFVFAEGAPDPEYLPSIARANVDALTTNGLINLGPRYPDVNGKDLQQVLLTTNGRLLAEVAFRARQEAL